MTNCGAQKASAPVTKVTQVKPRVSLMKVLLRWRGWTENVKNEINLDIRNHSVTHYVVYCTVSTVRHFIKLRPILRAGGAKIYFGAIPYRILFDIFTQYDLVKEKTLRKNQTSTF